jgi:hypothetical protein
MADALTVHARRGAGLLLDRLQEPVLPEYTCNVIRKCNTKIDLMCPFAGLLVLWCKRGAGVNIPLLPGFVGFKVGLLPVSTAPATSLFK